MSQVDRSTWALQEKVLPIARKASQSKGKCTQAARRTVEFKKAWENMSP